MLKRVSIVMCAMILFLVLAPLPARAQVCNRVAGGSQTSNWYGRGSGFESLVVDAEWERQTRGGQSVGAWGIGGTGWSTRIWSACTPATSPTRFILQVSPDHEDELDDVVVDLVAAIDAIHTIVPTATRITLVPPVGGPCPVGLADAQPMVIDAISQVIGGDVDAGPTLLVPDCAMFRDNAGHLSASGQVWVAEQMAALL